MLFKSQEADLAVVPERQEAFRTLHGLVLQLVLGSSSHGHAVCLMAAGNMLGDIADLSDILYDELPSFQILR